MVSSPMKDKAASVQPVTVTRVEFELERNLAQEETEAARGVIVNLRTNDIRFHGHPPAGERRWDYPVVQYKILDGHFNVLGLNGVAKSVEELAVIKRMELSQPDRTGDKLEVKRVTVRQGMETVGFSEELVQYRFLTPWIPFRTRNFLAYQQTARWVDKEAMLRYYLTRHIGTAVQAMAPDLYENHEAWLSKAQVFLPHYFASANATRVLYKDVPMLAFEGKFSCNVLLPQLIGVGNKPSFGFGTLVRIES